MQLFRGFAACLTIATLAVFGATLASAHGDVSPQPVNTEGLDKLGDEWLEKNPYRGNARAVEIGTSGYAQNCARCHGLQVISGGLSPDLRYLEKGDEGDEWFIQRIRHGATVNGVTHMPAFEGILSQEAMWAIRTYVESKHEE
jgi:cytochrome c-550 PedF